MNPLRIPGPPVVCRTLTGRRRDSHPARQPQAVSQAMRQAVAAAGRSVMVPPLESNQPCLVTRAAHQIALRRHRSSPQNAKRSLYLRTAQGWGSAFWRLRGSGAPLSAEPLIPILSENRCFVLYCAAKSLSKKTAVFLCRFGNLPVVPHFG